MMQAALRVEVLTLVWARVRGGDGPGSLEVSDVDLTNE
jgi:hypothetical protein